MLIIFKGPAPDGHDAGTLQTSIERIAGETEHSPDWQERRDDVETRFMATGACRKEDGTPIVLSDFPPGWGFGNGVTCSARVRLSDGIIYNLSWAVFPNPSESSLRGMEAALCAVMERPQ